MIKPEICQHFLQLVIGIRCAQNLLIRKLPEKFLEYAQYAGMAILLLLMLYANGNDWFGWGK